MSLEEQLKRKEQEALFAEYNSLAYKIRSLGGIIQNPTVHRKEGVEEWLKEAWERKSELDELIEATVKSVGFTLQK